MSGMLVKPHLRVALAVGAVVLLGAVVGWVFPRGPVTTLQALGCIAGACMAGLCAGWLMRSGWAILVVALLFMASFEVARLRIEGPTVDGVSVSNLYGIIALVGGRGVDAVLLLLPLLVGCGWGLAVAARTSGTDARRRPGARWASRAALGVVTAALVLLMAGLLRPASTAPIVDEANGAVDGSIAELVEVDVGGHAQSVMLRGASADAPILLFLEGGPGGTALGRIRNSGQTLEQHFVVATWDQRGTGKSYKSLEPTTTLTVHQMVSDTIEVTRHLLGRFDEHKLYLVGSSWGTIIGTLAVERNPELFHAWVGTGQMVDPFETDQLMYAENLADAQARGDEAAMSALEAIGAPPYTDTLHYPVAISSNPKWMRFQHGDDYNASSEYPMSLFVNEYTLVEQLRGMAAIAETYHVLYPQLAGTDLRVDVPRLAVPVYVVEGKYEAAGRAVLAREWFNRLDAPEKHHVLFERSGHTPPYDEPSRFAQLMATIRDAHH